MNTTLPKTWFLHSHSFYHKGEYYRLLCFTKLNFVPKKNTSFNFMQNPGLIKRFQTKRKIYTTLTQLCRNNSDRESCVKQNTLNIGYLCIQGCSELREELNTSLSCV